MLTRFRIAILSFMLGVSVFLQATSQARAEYRAYRLAITDSKSGKVRTVLTTLDHLQYRGYNYVKPDEIVTIADTWMCWKRSDNFKALCPSPHPSTSSGK